MAGVPYTWSLLLRSRHHNPYEILPGDLWWGELDDDCHQAVIVVEPVSYQEGNFVWRVHDSHGNSWTQYDIDIICNRKRLVRGSL